MPEKVWFCKIGFAAEEDVPEGGDAPMRDAVERAFRQHIGYEAPFTFSGWGGDLTESERAVIEDRDPRPFPGGDAKVLAHMDTDAAKWADQFIHQHRLALDHDTVKGWFANAIETGRAAGEGAS